MTGNKLYVKKGTIDAVYILRMLQAEYWPEVKVLYVFCRPGESL